MVTEPSRWISSVTRPRDGASASRWRCMSRPRRTMRPCSRSAASSAGRVVGRRLEAGGAQALLERERGGRERSERRRGGGAAAGSGGSGSGSPRSSRARRASRSRLGPWRGGSGSSTTPPPSVSGGASERITTRSPRRGDERLLEPELEVAAAELREPRRGLARAVVDGDARAAVGARVGRGPGERDVDPERRRRRRRRRRPPRRRRARTSSRLDAGQVERHALAGLGALDAARRGPAPSGARARARRGGSRTSSPRAAVPSHSVPVTTVPAPRIVNERSTCSRSAPARAAARRSRAATRSSAARSSSSPSPAGAATGDDLGARQQLRRLRARARRIGEVGLRDRHHARPSRPARQHRGVLARLRHHAVVGGDDHQEQVDAGRARDHRAHEALVARHVDHRQPPPDGSSSGA